MHRRWWALALAQELALALARELAQALPPLPPLLPLPPLWALRPPASRPVRHRCPSKLPVLLHPRHSPCPAHVPTTRPSPPC